jgi:serine O-acetyltransferase
MVTLRQTFVDLSADIQRRMLLENKRGFFSVISVLLKRGMVAVVIYRISRYCVYRRLGFIHRMLFIIGYFYTKNEISPKAKLGPGLVLDDRGGIGITQVTTAGKNCTFLGGSVIALGAIKGMDINRDQIILGDHCVIGTRVKIMRPIKLADGTQIMPNSVVMRSAENIGSTLLGMPAKRHSVQSFNELIKWNPLYGGYIVGFEQ